MLHTYWEETIALLSRHGTDRNPSQLSPCLWLCYHSPLPIIFSWYLSNWNNIFPFKFEKAVARLKLLGDIICLCFSLKQILPHDTDKKKKKNPDKTSCHLQRPFWPDQKKINICICITLQSSMTWNHVLNISCQGTLVVFLTKTPITGLGSYFPVCQ